MNYTTRAKRNDRFAATCALAFVMFASLTSAARADQPSIPKLKLAVSDLDQAAPSVASATPQPEAEVLTAPVPRECKPKYMAGPATGVVLGPAAIIGGATMLVAGSISWLPTATVDRGMVAGGSLLMASGIATLVYSSVKLAKNRRARKRICR